MKNESICLLADTFKQGLKWGGMGWYGIPPSQSLSHGHTVYEMRKERLGNVTVL